jgi:type IV pilus assembly protein PilB
MMLINPTAHAFMRRILADPADPVPRLVFADWLEETGTSSNLAWARFLRLANELANTTADDPRRPKLAGELERVGSLIRARLTYRAEVFVAYPEAMGQLLPLRNMVLNLRTLTLPREVIELTGGSLAYEFAALPLVKWDRTLALAVPDPLDQDCYLRLRFAMNQDILFIKAPVGQLQAAIERHYGHLDVREMVVSGPHDSTVTFAGQTRLVQQAMHDRAAVGRLVDSLLESAIRQRASALAIETRADDVFGSWTQVWHYVPGGRRAEDSFPNWLMPDITDRLRKLADIAPVLQPVQTGVIPLLHRGLSYRLPVRITATSNGPHIHVTIPPTPTDPPAVAVNPAA